MKFEAGSLAVRHCEEGDTPDAAISQLCGTYQGNATLAPIVIEAVPQ